MTETEQTSKLIEHLLKIVEAITLELKDHKLIMSANDKNLALVDQRLQIAENMLARVEKMQSNERIEAASRVGGEKIKWAIIAFIGGGLLTVIFKLLAGHIA